MSKSRFDVFAMTHKRPTEAGDYIMELQRQLAEREWISVEDRLPHEGQLVFVYCKENDRIECVPFAGEFPLVIVNWLENECKSAVTHWMPLPLPPIQEPEE